jgi:spermidine synthase
LVVDLSKKYLPEWANGAFDEPRANVIIGDALAYMREHDERYGVIISDLTEPLEDSPSNILFNEDVFKLIKSRLAPGGIYVLQASTAAFHNYSLHCKMSRTLRRHYAHVTSFFTYVPAFDTDWAFLACSDAVDLAALDPAKVNAYCGQLRGDNFFYDGETHERIFSLPLYLRRALAAPGPVF